MIHTDTNEATVSLKITGDSQSAEYIFFVLSTLLDFFDTEQKYLQKMERCFFVLRKPQRGFLFFRTVVD